MHVARYSGMQIMSFNIGYHLKARWHIFFIIFFETDIGGKHLRKVK